MTVDSLPDTWGRCQIDEIGDVITGSTPSKKNEDYYGGAFPIFKPTDLNAGFNVRLASEYLSDAGKSESRCFPSGCTLVTCIGATIGKTGFSRVAGTCNQQINVIIPYDSIYNEWVYFFVCSPQIQKEIVENSSSTTLPILNKSKFSVIEIPLPPLAEQKQIAAKLDELLAQVDTIKTRLDAIPHILKRFRQSVLAAAVSGKLTEEWRTLRISDQWEEVKLIDVINEKPRNGFSPKGVERETPYKNLTLSSITKGYFSEGQYKYIDGPISEDSYLWVNKGDVLIQRANSLEYVGISAIYKGESRRYIYPDLIMKFTPSNRMIGDYLHYCLLSGNVRKYFRDNATGTAGNMPKINQGVVSSAPINLPPLEEQTEIVRRVEQLFAYADQIEQRVKDAQTRVNHLTQSILAKAFRGELTADWRAQNPDLISGENSAEALLARIRAEREASAAKSKARQRKAKA